MCAELMCLSFSVLKCDDSERCCQRDLCSGAQSQFNKIEFQEEKALEIAVENIRKYVKYRCLSSAVPSVKDVYSGFKFLVDSDA